jgi:murein DD-endopeptidase MepM/ murein hydrolase activator NlpD
MDLRVLLATGAVLAAFALAPAGRGPVVRVASAGSAPVDGTSTPESPCPAGHFPDGNACVAFGEADEGSDAPVLANAHHVKNGAWVVYDQIGRRPDRPADYDAYRYPIPPGLPNGKSVISGYDLDRPDVAQRRGRTLKAVGHGGVDLPQAKGTRIPMIVLDHQQGDAEVVFVGPLFGNTVITLHTLREAGQLRDYLLLFGHLDGPAPGLTKGQTLREGDLVGFVGDTGSPELVHLHLEARRVREGVDVRSLPVAGGGAVLLADATSIVCDPRNVLPLR